MSRQAAAAAPSGGGRTRVAELRQRATGHQQRFAAAWDLLLHRGHPAWIDVSGWSMFPLSPPRGRLRVVPLTRPPEKGQVVVLAAGDRLLAHRVVELDPARRRCRTKGDAVHYFDDPVPEGELLGTVDGVTRRGGLRPVGSDADLAELSRRLGRLLAGRGWLRLPPSVKGGVYWTLYLPSLLYRGLSSLWKRRETREAS